MHLLALALPAAALVAATFTAPAPHLQGSPISVPGCTGAVTTTGAPAICEVYGNPVASANDAQLVASGLPPNQFGIFMTSLVGAPPMVVNSGNGWLCINPAGSNGIGRFFYPNQIQSSGPLGQLTLDTTAGQWDLSALPTATGGPYAAMPGMTSHFAAWFREPVGAGWNFSGTALMTWQ